MAKEAEVKHVSLVSVQGTYRYQQLIKKEEEFVDLWKNDVFIGLSLAQKCGKLYTILLSIQYILCYILIYILLFPSLSLYI